MSERIYEIVVKLLVIFAVVAFLNTVQATTIDRTWRTPFAIACVVIVTPMVISLKRPGLGGFRFFLQMLLVLAIYETGNVGRIAYGAAGTAPMANSEGSEVRRGVSDNMPHVFLIVLDEFGLTHAMKGNELDPGVVVHLKEFAEGAIWYRGAVTPFAETANALPAILAGRKGERFEEVFMGPVEVENIFTKAALTHKLHISGYALPYCEAFGKYAETCRNFRSGFTSYRILFLTWWDRTVPGELRKTGLLSPVKNGIAGMFEPPHQQRVEGLTKALELGQNFRTATFTYIHAGVPHFPYVFSASGQAIWDPLMDKELEEASSADLRVVEGRYEEQIRFTDRLVGRMIQEVKRNGIYERSLIIVTSDHGMSFKKERPGRKQEWIGDADIRRVPLFVRLPGSRGGTIVDCEISLTAVYTIVTDVLDGTIESEPEAYCTPQ